jgi:UDP-glucuronate 4-epimerase
MSISDNKEGYILVTGTAGLIGFHVARALLDKGRKVVGIDNINDYYDIDLKYARLKVLGLDDNSLRELKNNGAATIQRDENFVFSKNDICNYDNLNEIAGKYKIERICHLAAQAGVRYSIENPFAYQRSNLEGFQNIIELARHNRVENFVYASSSSVYGGNTKLPFSEEDSVDNPISLYAATKRSNELTAHTYSHLYGLPCTGLRYFTVYGPWGRPDMALFTFTKNIIEGKPIEVYNHGKMVRNFTYIDDVIAGTVAGLDRAVPFEIYNLGNDRAEELMDFIREIEKNLCKKAEKKMMEIQPGDVPRTIADISRARRGLGYDPKTNIDKGIKVFIEWYRSYYAE